MNILYIAYSCNPYAGSEDKIGWNIPRESAKTNNVYVITKEEQRVYVDKYLLTHKVNNIKFYFVDIPQTYKKIFKGFFYSGRLNIWNRQAYKVAKLICKEHHIDVIHQITPVEFRAIGNYGKIPGVKFVCGPIGGGEFVPRGLQRYTRRYRMIEVIRCIVNYWKRFWIKITKRLNHCDCVMFANHETRKFLKVEKNTNLITEIAIDENDIDYGEDKLSHEKIVFLVAGRVIYRKGHQFLLDAIRGIPEDLDYICRIIGTGPDLQELKLRCSRDEYIRKHIDFVGAVPYDKMETEYKKADVLIMPSIRETTGTVLLEAMSKGLPIVTIRQFGGALLVDDTTGWLYQGENTNSYIEHLRQIMIEIIKQPEEILRRGNNARIKSSQFTWNKKNEVYQELYDVVLRDCES